MHTAARGRRHDWAPPPAQRRHCSFLHFASFRVRPERCSGRRCSRCRDQAGGCGQHDCDRERLRELDADQLCLLFEDAVTDDAVTGEAANDDTLGDDAPPAPIRRGGRAPLPAHLPRREIEHLPGTGSDRCARPGCDGAQVRIGQDVTEILDYIPARFEVIRHIRPRLACRACERIMQAPVPSLPIPKARATSALLAHLLVSRFADHLPWYRQSAILRRAGVEIDRDLMGNWAGKIAWLMVPLVDRMMVHVLAAAKIHGDDTPVTLLIPGASGTSTAHFWVYLRDDRSSGDSTPPAVVYRFSADRRGTHPAAHLRDYAGYFQADAFAGYNALYRDRVTGAARSIVEVGCWSHVRRKFNDEQGAIGDCCRSGQSHRRAVRRRTPHQGIATR